MGLLCWAARHHEMALGSCLGNQSQSSPRIPLLPLGRVWGCWLQYPVQSSVPFVSGQWWRDPLKVAKLPLMPRTPPPHPNISVLVHLP